MTFQVLGCHHHDSTVEFREQLTFTAEQAHTILSQLQQTHPDLETVLLSTCNRVEIYMAAEEQDLCPPQDAMIQLLADFHNLQPADIADQFQLREDKDAVRHLFATAASLDSMVVGEAQILSQVKDAYELATQGGFTGSVTHTAFQAAMRVAKRVATETTINQRRVSIPSIAVADFANRFFENFADKNVLVIGAGEMGEETLRYLIDQQATQIHIVNRDLARAQNLVERTQGEARPWEELDQLLVDADLVVSTTSADDPIVTVERFQAIAHQRHQRTLLVLDLAVPRDFEAAVGEFVGVYLYCIDDLDEVCQRNKDARSQQWPHANEIIDEESGLFMAELAHRSTGPWIQRLQDQAQQLKSDELERLLNKLGENANETVREELDIAFDRLINKLLHPPLESLRNGAHDADHRGLVDALKKLFRLKE